MEIFKTVEGNISLGFPFPKTLNAQKEEGEKNCLKFMFFSDHLPSLAESISGGLIVDTLSSL